MKITSDQLEARKLGTPLLFVDDDPIAHIIMKTHLEEWNMIPAYSAEEALDILEKRHILIVITDIGLHGYRTSGNGRS